MTDDVDYETLLVKYLAHVGHCEGVVFMSDSRRRTSPVVFTEAEWRALERAADASES